MENDCSVCHHPNTKYSCISCAVTICNVCSVPANEDDLGYSEENYRVGKCQTCPDKKSCPAFESLCEDKVHLTLCSEKISGFYSIPRQNRKHECFTLYVKNIQCYHSFDHNMQLIFCSLYMYMYLINERYFVLVLCSSFSCQRNNIFS